MQYASANIEDITEVITTMSRSIRIRTPSSFRVESIKSMKVKSKLEAQSHL